MGAKEDFGLVCAALSFLRDLFGIELTPRKVLDVLKRYACCVSLVVFLVLMGLYCWSLVARNRELEVVIAKQDTEMASIRSTQVALTKMDTTTSTPTPEVYGVYEWQWAGENWYGRVTLEKVSDKNIISQAKVGLIGKTGEGRVWMDGQVLMLVEDGGSFEINDDGGIEINLRVKKKHRLTGEVNQEILKGTLQQTQCFAGRVTYSGEIGTYYGDMMLVDYRSDFALSVDDWFSNEQEWFEKYLIDCD